MEETNTNGLDLRLVVAAVSLLVVLAVPVVALTGLITPSEDSVIGRAPSGEVPPFGPRLVHVVAHDAFPPPLHGGMAFGGHAGPDQMLQLPPLGLTDAQQDQIFKIFHERASAVHEQLKQVRRSGEELRKLAIADRFDDSRARQLAEAQAKAVAALAVMRAQTMSQVRAILTPDQRARMDQLAERRGAGFGYGVGVKD